MTTGGILLGYRSRNTSEKKNKQGQQAVQVEQTGIVGGLGAKGNVRCEIRKVKKEQACQDPQETTVHQLASQGDEEGESRYLLQSKTINTVGVAQHHHLRGVPTAPAMLCKH